MLPATVWIALLFVVWLLLRRTILANNDDFQVGLSLVIVWLAAFALIVAIPTSSTYEKQLYSGVLSAVIIITGVLWFVYLRIYLRPRFLLEKTEQDKAGKIGFKVRIERKNIDDVYVICDDRNRMWEIRGKEKEKAPLIKGNIAIPFFPYETAIKMLHPSTLVMPRDTQVTLEASVQDRDTKETVARREITFLAGAEGDLPIDSTVSLEFTSKVRFVALGLDVVKDYPYALALEDFKLIGEPKGEARADGSQDYSYHYNANVVLKATSSPSTR